MLMSTGKHAGVPMGLPPLATSTGTPAQFSASMRTDVLLFWSMTRSGTGLPAAADWAQVGRPVMPPRFGSQHAQVVARMRELSLEVAMIETVWLPVFGSLGTVIL